MTDTQKAAIAALSGLRIKAAPTAQEVTGGKHDANGCGGQLECGSRLN